MKEQIQKLAEQANIKYGAAVDYYYSPATDGVTRQDMAKFAVLIVEECAKICVEQNVSNIDLDVIHESGKFTVQELATKSCGENLAKQIKQHFGVEE